MSDSDFDVAEADRLLTTTRAVRKRLDLSREVPRRVILDAIDVALQAPSGSNSQPWRWLVVADAATRAGLAAIYQRAFEQYITPRAAETSPDDHNSLRMMDSAAYLAEHMAEVPLLVIPCALVRADAVGGGESGASFYGGILPAVWSFQLALRARGVGSAWTTLHLRAEREAAELLGIPDTVSQVALLPVAYYTGTDFRRAPRKPASAVTYWDRWKQKAPVG